MSEERQRGANPRARSDRIAQIVREEIASVLDDEIEDARLEGVRIVSAEVSSDGRHARVSYAVPKERFDDRARRDAIARALERANGFFRARLADAIELKRVPELTFVFDAVASAAVHNE